MFEVINKSYENIINSLAEVCINSTPLGYKTCSPPPSLVKNFSCDGQTGLTGMKLAKPRRILHMFTFGFEVDTLEILLREEAGVVNFFFLVAMKNN